MIKHNSDKGILFTLSRHGEGLYSVAIHCVLLSIYSPTPGDATAVPIGLSSASMIEWAHRVVEAHIRLHGLGGKIWRQRLPLSLPPLLGLILPSLYPVLPSSLCSQNVYYSPAVILTTIGSAALSSHCWGPMPTGCSLGAANKLYSMFVIPSVDGTQVPLTP